MSQSDKVLQAGDALATDVFDAYLDGSYSSFRMRLYAAHNSLTTQMWLVRSHRAEVDAAPASKAAAAVSKCRAASQAFRSATTAAARSKAVSHTFAAMDAINGVLPQQVRDFA
jgi:hypothetical protein